MVRVRASRQEQGGWELRGKLVMPPLEHQQGIVLDKGKGVAVEVTEHGIAIPMADNADFIRVNTGEKEGHSATAAEGASGNAGGGDTTVARDGDGCGTEEAGDHGRGNSFAAGSGVVIDMER